MCWVWVGVQGFGGFGVWTFGCWAQALGFRVFAFGVLSLRFGISDFGFRNLGPGSRVLVGFCPHLVTVQENGTTKGCKTSRLQIIIVMHLLLTGVWVLGFKCLNGMMKAKNMEATTCSSFVFTVLGCMRVQVLKTVHNSGSNEFLNGHFAPKLSDIQVLRV